MPPNSPQNRLDANLHMAEGDDVKKNTHAYDNVQKRISTYMKRITALDANAAAQHKNFVEQPLKALQKVDCYLEDPRNPNYVFYVGNDGQVWWQDKHLYPRGSWNVYRPDWVAALMERSTVVRPGFRFGREYMTAANWKDVDEKSAEVDRARQENTGYNGQLTGKLKSRIFWKVAELEKHYSEVEQLIADLETKAKIDLKDPARLSNQLKKTAADGLKQKMNLSEKAADAEKLQTIHVDRYNEPFTNMDQRVYHLLRVPAHAQVSFVYRLENKEVEADQAVLGAKQIPASGGYKYFELSSQFTRNVDTRNIRLKVIMDNNPPRYARIDREPRLNNLIFTFDKIDEDAEKKRRQDEDEKQKKEKDEREKKEAEKKLKEENDKKEEEKKKEEQKDRERIKELQKVLQKKQEDFAGSVKGNIAPEAIISKIRGIQDQIDGMLKEKQKESGGDLFQGDERIKIQSIKDQLHGDLQEQMKILRKSHTEKMPNIKEAVELLRQTGSNAKLQDVHDGLNTLQKAKEWLDTQLKGEVSNALNDEDKKEIQKVHTDIEGCVTSLQERINELRREEMQREKTNRDQQFQAKKDTAPAKELLEDLKTLSQHVDSMLAAKKTSDPGSPLFTGDDAEALTDTKKILGESIKRYTELAEKESQEREQKAAIEKRGNARAVLMKEAREMFEVANTGREDKIDSIERIEYVLARLSELGKQFSVQKLNAPTVLEQADISNMERDLESWSEILEKQKAKIRKSQEEQPAKPGNMDKPQNLTPPAKEPPMPEKPGTMEQKPEMPAEDKEKAAEVLAQETAKKLCILLTERLGKVFPHLQFTIKDAAAVKRLADNYQDADGKPIDGAENPLVIVAFDTRQEQKPNKAARDVPKEFLVYPDVQRNTLSINGEFAASTREGFDERADAFFSHIARQLGCFTQNEYGKDREKAEETATLFGVEGLALRHPYFFEIEIPAAKFDIGSLTKEGLRGDTLQIAADRVEMAGDTVKFFEGNTLVCTVEKREEGFAVINWHDHNTNWAGKTVRVGPATRIESSSKSATKPSSASAERLLNKAQKAEKRREEENAEYDKETNALREKAAKSLVNETTPKLLIAEYIKLLERAERITDGIITDTVENRKALTPGLQNLFVFLARENPQVRSTAYTLAFSKDGRERELGGKILSSLAVDDQLVQRNLRGILRTGRLPHFEAENSSNPSVAPSMPGTALDTLAGQYGDRTLAADIRNVLGAIYLRAVQLRTQESASSLKEGLYEYADIEESSLTDDDRRNVEILKKTLFINWTWKNTYEQEGKKTEIAKLIVRILKKGPQEAREIMRKMADIDTEDTRKNALHLLLDGLVKKNSEVSKNFEPADSETQELLAEIVMDKKNGVDLRRSALMMLTQTSYFSGGNDLCKNIILSFLRGQDATDRSLAIYALDKTNRLSKEFFFVLFGEDRGIPKANQNFDAPEQITTILLDLVNTPDLPRHDRTSILRILRWGQAQLNSRIEWYSGYTRNRALVLNTRTNELFLNVFKHPESDTEDLTLAAKGILTNGRDKSIAPRIHLLKVVSSLDAGRKGIVLRELSEHGRLYDDGVIHLLENRLKNPGANPEQDAQIQEYLSVTQDFLKSVFDAKPPVSFDVFEEAVFLWRDVMWTLEKQIGITSAVPPIALTISDTYLDRIANEEERSSMRTYFKRLQDNGLTSR